MDYHQLFFLYLQKDHTNSKDREKRPPFKFKSGAVYDGEWVGNMRDGYGIQTWPDGAKYEGNYIYISQPK